MKQVTLLEVSLDEYSPVIKGPFATEQSLSIDVLRFFYLDSLAFTSLVFPSLVLPSLVFPSWVLAILLRYMCGLRTV